MSHSGQALPAAGHRPLQARCSLYSAELNLLEVKVQLGTAMLMLACASESTMTSYTDIS